MSTLIESQQLLKRIAEPRPVGDSVKAAINRAARRLRWSHSRVKHIWYAEPRTRISAEEYKQLETAAYGKDREDFQQLRRQISDLQARLNQMDADFHGPQVEALRAAACLDRNETD